MCRLPQGLQLCNKRRLAHQVGYHLQASNMKKLYINLNLFFWSNLVMCEIFIYDVFGVWTLLDHFPIDMVYNSCSSISHLKLVQSKFVECYYSDELH